MTETKPDQAQELSKKLIRIHTMMQMALLKEQELHDEGRDTRIYMRTVMKACKERCVE